MPAAFFFLDKAKLKGNCVVYHTQRVVDSQPEPFDAKLAKPGLRRQVLARRARQIHGLQSLPLDPGRLQPIFAVFPPQSNNTTPPHRPEGAAASLAMTANNTTDAWSSAATTLNPAQCVTT
jgi:hypothetical protein